MKSFRFRLQRVLSWRGTQLSLAEAKMEQLHAGVRATDQAIAEFQQGRMAEQAATERNLTISGTDVGAMEMSRAWAAREQKRLAARKSELMQSIEVQNSCVAEARRGVKLVERLKVQNFESWKVEADRELEQLAAESAIAQWRRLTQ